MRVFTFYPYRADGVGLTIESYEEASDTDAEHRAGHVLLEHRSAAYVLVCDADRVVCTIHRKLGVVRREPGQCGVAQEAR